MIEIRAPVAMIAGTLRSPGIPQADAESRVVHQSDSIQQRSVGEDHADAGGQIEH